MCRPVQFTSASFRVVSQLNTSLDVSGGMIASSFANVLVKEANVSKIYESDVDLLDCMPSCVDHFPIIEWLVLLGCAAVAMATLKFDSKVYNYKISMIQKWKRS